MVLLFQWIQLKFRIILNNQTVTIEESDKAKKELPRSNVSLNSSSAHTLLTKSKTDFYKNNVFQNKFYEVVSLQHYNNMRIKY